MPSARATFDAQLELLDAEMLVMGSSIEEQTMAAVALIEGPDPDRARRIIDGDDDIDRQERSIEAVCLKLLLAQQPVAADLRRVSAALKMVGDMERIGDQAADIAEIVAGSTSRLDAELSSGLSELGRRASAMVHGDVEAYVDRDPSRVRSVISGDARVNDKFDAVVDAIAQAIRDSADEPRALVDALMVAKHLERVGDHAKNIAFWVEYTLTGRYKGDLIG